MFRCSRLFSELSPVTVKEHDSSSVSIECGDVPLALKNVTRRHDWWQTASGEYLLQVPGVARFHVTAEKISVHPEPKSDDSAVRLYLFGSVMGALLHLRGVLPLHGSAISLAHGEGAAVFTGVSSAGKSTLAAALGQRGYRLMADDISAIRVSSDGYEIYPGLTRSKLWRKSLDFLQLNLAEGDPVRSNKYAFEMAVTRQPTGVTHIYELVLRDGAEMTITKVEGVEKLRLLNEQTFRRNYISGFGQSGPHLRRLAMLAGQVRISQIIRPPSEELSVGAIIDLLERDWAR